MPSITRPRTHQSKRRADTETAVLAAIERLLMGGASFTELSVRRIADAAGIARSTFYLRFQGKTELLLRLTSSMKEDLFAMGAAWLPTGADGHDHQGLVEMFTRQLAYYRERAPLLTAISEVTAYDDTLRQETRQSLARFTQRTVARLRDEQHANRLTADVDPVAVGEALIWSGEHVIARQVTLGDRKDDAAIARALADLHWFGGYRRPACGP